MDNESSPAPSGKVYLVGSGPGAHDLLTLRAARLIADADAIVYDHLIADDALALARPGCERICAGKKASNHTLPQDELNLLLVELAREKLSVVRLKGGDPFVFGRGGEEALTLVNSWYADRTTRAKAIDVAGAVNRIGVERLAAANGFGRLYLGHTPFLEFIQRLTAEQRGERAAAPRLQQHHMLEPQRNELQRKGG